MRCQRLSAHKSQRLVKVRRSEWWSQNGHTQETNPPKQGQLLPNFLPKQISGNQKNNLQTNLHQHRINELLWNLRAPPDL